MMTATTTTRTPNELQKQALAFDLADVTERYVKSFGVSREIAELHELECKKYLLLCALYPKAKLGMKGPVDNYWHTFLLFTKDYSRFCQKIAGFFIHHVPNTNKEQDKDTGAFPATMELYKSMFGENPDTRAWAYNLASSCNADCKDDCSSGPGDSDCSPSKDCSGDDCSSDGN